MKWKSKTFMGVFVKLVTSQGLNLMKKNVEKISEKKISWDCSHVIFMQLSLNNFSIKFLHFFKLCHFVKKINLKKLEKIN